MKRSSLSVIIPCFNSGHYLGETLKSLAAQSRQPDEIIVVDDGSTAPETLEFLTRLPAQVKLLRQTNQGPGAARNAGIRAATGELIFPLDSDDLITPRALEQYEQALLADPGASFACSHVELFGALEDDFAIPRFNGYLELQENYLVSTALIHKRVFSELGIWYPTEGGYEDWSFWLSCVEAGLRGAVVEARLFRYRRKHGEGVLFEHNQKQQQFRHALRERHAALYSEQGRARVKLRCAPGLELLSRAGSLDGALARQTLTDLVVTPAGTSSARDYLQSARGKYVVEVDAACLALLERARPSFLEQVVRLFESRPDVNAIAVPVDAPTLLAARASQRVALCPQDRAQRHPEDLVFFRVASERLATRLSLPAAASTAELFRRPVARGNALLCAYEFFGPVDPSGTGAPGAQASPPAPALIEDQLLWRSPARYLRPAWKSARKTAVAFFGEERTSRKIHGWKVKLEHALLRDPPQPQPQKRSAVGAILPESRRIELLHLDHVPVRFERETPIVSTPGKKRIAVILPWITTGGVDRGAIDVASLLPKDRYELLLVTQYRSRHEWEHRMMPHLTDAIHLGDSVPPNEQVGRVVQLVRDRGVDGLFMSNSWLGYEASMAVKRRLPGVRTTDLQHTDFQAKGGDFARQSCKRYDRFLDLRMVTHEYLKRRYLKYGADAAKIRVIYMSCDDQGEFNPEKVAPGWLHEKLRLPYGAVLVAFLGRLVEDKDPVFVTRVYGALQRQWTDARRPLHFIFVGEGPLREAIEKEAEAQGIAQKIHLLPADTPMPRAMRDLSLVLMASRIEGLPFVFFEAMSLNVPVVTTKIEGIPELVDGEVGACVPNLKDADRRLDALRDAALPILEDPALRARLGKQARQKVLDLCSREYTRHALEAAFGTLFAPGQHGLSLAAND